MTLDPRSRQRYADLLADPANADLEEVIGALDAYYTVTALPATLSQAHGAATPASAPRLAVHDHGTHPQTKKGLVLMEKPTPMPAHPAKRSYPLIAIVALVLLAGAFFGVRAAGLFHPQNGAPGGSGAKTATPVAYYRWDMQPPAIAKNASSPIASLALGGGDNVVTLQVHLDSRQAHPGDVVTVAWEVAGVSQTSPKCCRWQVGDPVQDLGFSLKLTGAGAGLAKVSYNGTLAYTISFTVIASSTPLPSEPTPTPVSFGTPAPTATQGPPSTPTPPAPPPTPAPTATAKPPPTPTPTPGT